MDKCPFSNTLKKIIFVMCLVASTGLFFRQAVVCISRFYSQDIGISLYIINSEQAEFPVMTICPNYFDAYNGDVLQMYNTSASEIRQCIFPQTLDISSYEFYDLVTHELNETLISVLIKVKHELKGNGRKYHKVQYSFEVPDKPKNYILYLQLDWKNWTVQKYESFGKCFTFKVPEFLRQSQIRSITIQVKKNSVLYLHHPEHFETTDNENKVVIDLGKILFISVKHDITIDYSKFMKDGSKTCDGNMDLGYDKCIHTNRDKRAMKSLGCTCPAMSHSKANPCNFINISDTQVTKLKNGLLDDIKAEAYDYDCSTPCSTMGIVYGYPGLAETNTKLGEVKMYFKSHITVKKSVLVYKETQLMAEIGGYIGLILGFSLLDLGKLLQSAYDRFCE